jgi:hypothetical protein
MTYFLMVDESIREHDIAGEVLLSADGPDEEGMLLLYSTKYFRVQVESNQAWEEMVRDAAPHAPKFCGPLLVLTTCEGDFAERVQECAARKYGQPPPRTELPDALAHVKLAQ